jgi:hypothetical protein
VLERCLDRRGQSSRIGCRLVAIGDAEAATEVDRLTGRPYRRRAATRSAMGANVPRNGGRVRIRLLI